MTLDRNKPPRLALMAGLLAAAAIMGGGVRAASAQVIVLTSPTDLGSSEVGTPLDQSVSIGNTADQMTDLEVTAISENPQAGDECDAFTVNTTALPLLIAGGTSDSVSVRFAPSGRGVATCTLSIGSNDPGSPSSLVLQATGLAPELTVSTATIDFPGTRVSASSPATASFTVTNNGDVPYTLDAADVALSAGGPVFGVVGSFAGTMLAVGQSATVELSFDPADPVMYTGQATVTATAHPYTHTETVALSGVGTAAQISAPASVAYDQVPVGMGSSMAIIVQNLGDFELTISSVTLVSQSPTGQFSIGTTPSGPIAGMGMDTITVSCQPTAVGLKTATLRIASDTDIGTSPTDIALSCTGEGPVISVSPISLAFDNQEINMSSAPRTLTISNAAGTGVSDLQVTGIVLGGTNPGDFAVTPTTGTVTPGGSLAVSVRFTPQAAGARSATMTIMSNDPLQPSVVVTLSGRGMLPPEITVSAAMLAFGQQQVSSPVSLQLTIFNAAGPDRLALNVTDIAVGGVNAADFSVSPSSGTVAAGGMLVVTVTFTPTVSGLRQAVLTIASNASNMSMLMLDLSGTGMDPPDIALSTMSIDFGSQRVGVPAMGSFDITNAMGPNRLPLTITSISATGDFSVSPSTGTVTPGGALPVDVTFTPTAAGVRSGTIVVASDDPDEASLLITVTGTGIEPDISVSPVALDLGTQSVGMPSAALPVTVSNIGSDALLIGTVSITGTNAADFAFTGMSNITLPAGQSTMYSVTCTPSITGTRTATLRIPSDDPDTATVTLGLTCVGVPSAISLTPSTVAFPDTYISTAATPIVAALRNETSNPIMVTAVSTSTNVFTATAPTPFTLSGGQEENITLGFMPPLATAYNGTLTIQSSAGTFTFPVTGSGVIADLELDPAPAPGMPLDFGEVRVGTESAPSMIAVRSIGSTGFRVLNVSVNRDDFRVTQPADTDLEPGSATAFEVFARPTAMGLRDAVVIVQTDIPGAMNVVFAVRATGIEPGIELSRSAIDFGGVDVQGGAAEETLTISNTGTALLSIDAVALSAGRFSLAPGQATSRSVIPGETFDITLVYQPDMEAADTATLTMSTDVSGSTAVAVAVSGRGIDRHIELSAMEMVFPETYRNPLEPSRQSLTIMNTGEAELRLDAIAIDQSGAGAFSIEMPAVMTVPPGSMRDVVVAFAPPAANSEFNATLMITNDDDQRPMAAVSLRGPGIAPNVVMSPAAEILLTTGVGVPVRLSEAVGEAIRVTNMDSQSFTVREIRIADVSGNPMPDTPFRVLGFEPGQALAARRSLDVEVEFAPDTSGELVVRIEVYLDVDPLPISFVTVRGYAADVELRGGGCALSEERPGAGGVLLLVVLAVLALRGRRGRAPAVVLVIGLIASVITLVIALGPARADSSRNLDLSTFRPAPGVEASMLSVESPMVGETGAWALGLVLSHALNPLTVRSVDDRIGEMTDSPITGRTVTDFMFSYALSERLELGAQFPILQQTGEAPLFSGIQPAEGTAIGDLALHGKVSVLDSSVALLGASLTVTLPTATDGQFAGGDGPSAELRALVGGKTKRVNVVINSGLRVGTPSRLADAEQGSALIYGVAAEYRVKRQLSAVGELFGSRAIGVVVPAAVSPLEAAAGVRYRLTRQLSMATGVGMGLVSGIGAPDVRGFLLVSYSPRSRQIPPLLLGPPPKPIDRGDDDGDDIINSDDECPTDAEDMDGFQDTDGCPDLDNDQDGVLDQGDKCPLEPEDRDGFQDADGCPDPDNDGDGIADRDDQCPDIPEDLDGFEDLDGCDDPDNDRDGILDVIDECVLEPETINGIKDEDGCPDDGDSLVIVMADRLELVEPIRFRGNTARLRKRSANLLGQVAAHMRAHSEFSRLRIAVHVQPAGRDDKQRSQRRADAIKRALIKRGVDPKRLEARGYGSSRPLAPPEQRGARDLNERTELIILEKQIKQ